MKGSPLEKGDICMVMGAQWGDEGKGKLIDILSEHADIVARCAGGNNAGHTVKVGDQTHFYHLLPSGIAHEHCKSILGNGVVINVPALFAEAALNEGRGLSNWEGRLFISDRAHLVFQMHQEIDALQEAEKAAVGQSIGTTKRGIGPSYAAKMSRVGLRVCDLVGCEVAFATKLTGLYNEYKKRWPGLEVDLAGEIESYKTFRKRVQPMVIDTSLYLHKHAVSPLAFGNDPQTLLIEGANAQMLDVDFGTYPYVTSSNCTSGGASTGLGIPPAALTRVFGVVKAYTTRVGAGPFPTEQLNQAGSHLQEIGHEYGVTTGRRRRCGWLDIMVVKYTAMINGLTSIMITKLDVLDSFDSISIGVAYKNTDGSLVESMPASLDDLERVDVVYETLPGWKSDISKCKTYDDLPRNAKLYLKRIEELVNIPIQYIGVGPEREATIRVF